MDDQRKTLPRGLNPPLEIVEFGQVLTNEDGSRWMRAVVRVYWEDDKSDTAIVTELRLPVAVVDGKLFEDMQREVLDAVPDLLRRAADLAASSKPS